MAGLHKRAFGIVMLLLGLIGLIPGLSALAGILLSIPAFQMIIGRTRPVFPRRISSHRLQKRQLARLVMRAIRFAKAKMLRQSSGECGIATSTATCLAEELFQDRRRR
jgi:hypothetical protein